MELDIDSSPFSQNQSQKKVLQPIVFKPNPPPAIKVQPRQSKKELVVHGNSNPQQFGEFSTNGGPITVYGSNSGNPKLIYNAPTQHVTVVIHNHYHISVEAPQKPHILVEDPQEPEDGDEDGFY